MVVITSFAVANKNATGGARGFLPHSLALCMVTLFNYYLLEAPAVLCLRIKR